MKKIKQRKLVVAICLLCGVNGAQAAISDGSILAGGSGQAGELFLNIWDEAATTSYSLDLGTTLENFYANKGATQSWTLGSSFTTWAALTTDTLTFNLAANNSYVGKTSAGDAVLLSSLTGSANTFNVNMTNLVTLGNNLSARAISLNAAANDLGNYAANLGAVTTDTADNAYFGYTFWGTGLGIANYAGSATVRNGATDETLDLVYIHAPGGAVLQSTKATVEHLQGILSLNTSASTLTWTAVPPTTVPVPAAMWLFLGGLLSLLKLQKRNAFSTVA